MQMGIHFLDTIGLYRLHLSLCRQGSIKHHSRFNKTFFPSPFFPFFCGNTSLFTAAVSGWEGQGVLAASEYRLCSLQSRLPHSTLTSALFQEPYIFVMPCSGGFLLVVFMCWRFLHFAYRWLLPPVCQPSTLSSFLYSITITYIWMLE